MLKEFHIFEQVKGLKKELWLSCILAASINVTAEPLDASLADARVTAFELSDAIELSLSFNQHDLKAGNHPSYKTSSWLATSPSLGVNFLQSQQTAGTDEAEVNLNLAIKSTLQRNIDRQTQHIAKQISEKQTSLSKLFFSGLIREALWAFKLASAKHSYFNEKLNILSKLERNNQKLVKAGQSSNYFLLLIQKERLATELLVIENQQLIAQWQSQYLLVTGTEQMPVSIDEEYLKIDGGEYLAHPELQIMTDLWMQKKLAFKENHSDALPWNVAISAKQLSSELMNETQLGINIEVPLSFIEVNRQSLAAGWSQASAQYQLDFSALSIAKSQQMEQHHKNRHYLLKKQALLKKSLALSNKIMNQLDRLSAQNEVEQELILRQVLDALKTKNDYSVANILIEQNNAMARQSAGISL